MKKFSKAFMSISEKKLYRILIAVALIVLLSYNFYPTPYTFPVFLVLAVGIIIYMIIHIRNEVRK